MRCRAHVFPAPGKLDKATNTLDLVGRNLRSVHRVSESPEVISGFPISTVTPRLTAQLLLAGSADPSPPFNGMGKLRLKEGKGCATWLGCMGPWLARESPSDDETSHWTSLVGLSALRVPHHVFQEVTAEPSWPSSDNSRLCRGGGLRVMAGQNNVSHQRAARNQDSELPVSVSMPPLSGRPLELCQGTWNPLVNVSQNPRTVPGHHRCLIKVTVTFPSCSSSYQPLRSAGSDLLLRQGRCCGLGTVPVTHRSPGTGWLRDVPACHWAPMSPSPTTLPCYPSGPCLSALPQTTFIPRFR